MRVHAEEIEVGVERARDVGADERVVGFAEQRARRRVARALQEHALAVDREASSRCGARRGTRRARENPSLGVAVDLDVELERAQRLRAERARPPARRVVDGQRPRELVRARSRASRSATRRAAPRRRARARPRAGAPRGARSRASRVTLHASRPRSTDASTHSTRARVDAHRARRREPDRSPDPARVQRAVEHRRLPVAAGDRALRGAVALRRARDLDREHVLVALAQRFGDLERVPGEVALGRAEVLAVEPHVAVVEDAVELEEPARVGRRPVVGRGPASRSGGGRAPVRRARRTRARRASGAGP